MKKLAVLFLVVSTVALHPAVSLALGEDTVFLTRTTRSHFAVRGKRFEETCSLTLKSVSVKRVIDEVEATETKAVSIRGDVANLLDEASRAKVSKTTSYAMRTGSTSTVAVAADRSTIVLKKFEGSSELENKSEAASILLQLADSLCK